VQCASEAPSCPVHKVVTTPYVGCCFNPALDCADECMSVTCSDNVLPTDACRARGQRWTGGTAGCCFNVETDCRWGDDANQMDERKALVALYAATNGSNWYRTAGSMWLSDAWVCFWDGIQCGGKAGDMHVTGVILPSNGLTGVLSDLKGLNHVTTIDLSDNSINGNVPSSLAQLPALRSLVLSKNQFAGQAPELFVNGSSLIVADLSSNFLTGVHDVAASGLKCDQNCVCGDVCYPRRSDAAAVQCPPCA